MIDISNLGVPTPHEQRWNNVLRRWKRKQRITKAEIVKLIEAGPIPENANDFMVAIVNGERLHGQGNTKTYKPSPLTDPETVVAVLHDVEAFIKNPSSVPDSLGQKAHQYYVELHRRAFHRRSGTRGKRPTAKQLAKQHVMEQFDIGDSRLRTCITLYNNNKKKGAST